MKMKMRISSDSRQLEVSQMMTSDPEIEINKHQPSTPHPISRLFGLAYLFYLAHRAPELPSFLPTASCIVLQFSSLVSTYVSLVVATETVVMTLHCISINSQELLKAKK